MRTAIFTPQGVHDPLASLSRAFRADGSWLAGCLLIAVALHGIAALTMPRRHRSSPGARDTPLQVIDINMPTAQSSPAPIPTEPAPLAAQLKRNPAAKEAQAAQAG